MAGGGFTAVKKSFFTGGLPGLVPKNCSATKITSATGSHHFNMRFTASSSNKYSGDQPAGFFTRRKE